MKLYKIALSFAFQTFFLISTIAQTLQTNDISNRETNVVKKNSELIQIATPTNEIARLSSVIGEVRILDMKGLLMKSNFTYLPRIPIKELNTNDWRELLENKVAFAVLTSFGDAKFRTKESEGIEKKMLDIWSKEKSLIEKFRTRMIILESMHTYNQAVASYSGGLRLSGTGEQTLSKFGDESARVTMQNWNAQNAVDNFKDSQMARGYSQRSVDYVAEHGASTAQLRQSVQNAKDAELFLEQKMINAGVLAVTGKRQADASLALGKASALQLANFGIVVSDSPPFTPIPSLIIRAEIDAERRLTLNSH